MTYRSSAWIIVLAGWLLQSCEQQSPVPAVQLTLSESCDVQIGCRATSEFLAATVTFVREPRALQPFPVKVLLEAGDQPDSVTVTFSMQGMEMGHNRYRLRGGSAGVWNAIVTLPICSAGRADWIADFDLQATGRHYRLQVPFVLEE